MVVLAVGLAAAGATALDAALLDVGGVGPALPGVSAAVAAPPSPASRGGVPLQLKQGGYCTALAPPAWRVSDTTADGTGIDLGDGTFHAGYGALGVDPMAMQAFAHLRTPQHFIHYVITLGFQAGGDAGIARASPPLQMGDLFVHEFDSARLHAVALYRVYPMPMGGYVLINRVAMGPRAAWASGGAVAVAVATSIRCQARLTGAVESSRPRGRGTAESAYNAQLGTEYAHDPVTGESFLMNHAGDWRDSGPDGPGYYRSVPNGVRRLTAGLAE